jgi:hypothetical protein
MIHTVLTDPDSSSITESLQVTTERSDQDENENIYTNK